MPDLYNYNFDDPQIAEEFNESLDELADSIFEATIKHMTSKEKLDAAKYRKSAAGKKAIAKHARKVAKAGYKVDKSLSKLMSKVAKFRKNEEIDEEFFDSITEDEIFEGMDVEDFATLDEFVDSCIEGCREACTDEELNDLVVDPETGETEVEEAFKHMTSAAKRKAKAYRHSAAGKLAAKKYARKVTKAGYHVDKSRSKLMSKLSKFRRESVEDFGLTEEENDSIDDLITSVISFVNEGCKSKNMREEMKDWEVATVSISATPEENIESHATDFGLEIEEIGPDDEDEEAMIYHVSGSPEDIENFMDELDLDDDELQSALVPCKCKDSDGEEMDEATIRHMTSAEKRKAKAYRRSSAGKAALKKHARKVAKAGYHVNKALSKKMSKVADLRREAVSESLDEAFNEITSFGSLNEAQSANIKNLCIESVISMLEISEQKILEDVSVAYDDYVNTELMPSIFDTLDNEYIPQLKEEYEDQIDAYLHMVAEEIAEELYDNKLIVKSKKTQTLESFSGKLLDLIKEELQIIPEQEDALDVAQNTVYALRESLEEEKINTLKFKSQLAEAKKEAYVANILAESTFAATTKEKLSSYAEDVLSDCGTYAEFVNYFDEAVSEAKRNPSVSSSKQSYQPIQENENLDLFSSFARKAMNLG